MWFCQEEEGECECVYHLCQWGFTQDVILLYLLPVFIYIFLLGRGNPFSWRHLLKHWHFSSTTVMFSILLLKHTTHFWLTPELSPTCSKSHSSTSSAPNLISSAAWQLLLIAAFFQTRCGTLCRCRTFSSISLFRFYTIPQRGVANGWLVRNITKLCFSL